MSKKKLFTSMLALLLVFALFAVGCTKDAPKESTPVESTPVESTPGTPAEPVYDKVTMRMASPSSSGTVNVDLMQWYCDEVNARSGGNVTIEFYPDAQLYGAEELPEAVMNGAIDIAHCATASTWTDYCPVFTYTESWLLWRTSEHVEENAQDYCDLLFPIWEKIGVKPLFIEDHGEGGLMTNVPIHTVEDFKGLILRGPTTPDWEAYTCLGATPVQMSSSEVYDAISKGALDGMRANYNTLIGRKIYDVCDYFLPGISNGVFGVLMNVDRWESLTADTQNLLLEVGAEAQAKSFKLMQEERNVQLETLYAESEAYELKGDDIAAFQKALEPYYENIMKAAIEKGYGAEAEKFLEIAART